MAFTLVAASNLLRQTGTVRSGPERDNPLFQGTELVLSFNDRIVLGYVLTACKLVNLYEASGADAKRGVVPDLLLTAKPILKGIAVIISEFDSLAMRSLKLMVCGVWVEGGDVRLQARLLVTRASLLVARSY